MTNYIWNFAKAKVNSAIIWVMLVSMLSISSHAQAVCYVNGVATGAKDGSSWTNAYTNPQFALLNSACTEIWVARGVYKPTLGTIDTVSFEIGPGVAMYGGFTGGESTRDARDPAKFLTILSGDIDNNDANADTTQVDVTSADIRGDNSRHVVTMFGTPTAKITASTVLNGFTITGGDAIVDFGGNGGGLLCDGDGEGNACSPTLGLDIFSGNNAGAKGGGMYNNGAEGGEASPTLTDVIFSGNSAKDGGGMFSISTTEHSDTPGQSSPTLFNVTFDHNTVSDAGGGMYNEGDDDGQLTPKLTNVTFSSNVVTSGANSGGAMYNTSNAGTISPDLTNVTFFGNSANFGGAMCNQSAPNSGGDTTPTLQNVTFNRNVAEFGGAIYNADVTGTSIHTSLNNVILWADIASAEAESAEIYSKVVASVYVDHSVLEAGCPTDMTLTCDTIYSGDPLLGALADNGGFTLTLLPAVGSSAIDTARDATCPPIDQRGTARPQGFHCDIGAVEVVATPPPVATPASVTTPINVPIPITLIGTDANPGGPFAYSPTKPVHGGVTISGNIATYTPDTDFTGLDSFDYTVTDTNGTSAPARVSITVTSGPPIAKSFAIEIPHNMSASMTVSATDPNVGTFTFTFALVKPTSHGTVSLSGDTAMYTPTHNYTGPDEFTYTATDLNGKSLPATVTILVDPAPPVADPKTVVVPFNMAKQITLSGSDNDNLGGPFTLTFALTSSPSHGTLSAISGNLVTYTPNHNYSGPDSFTYDTTDINGESKPALVQITVLPPGVGPPPPPSSTKAIPTLGTWSLLALAGLIGLTAIRRQRKSR